MAFIAAAFVVAVAARVHVAQGVVAGAAVVVTAVVVRGARFGEGFTALALFTLAMPARGDLDTFIGYPLRRLAADGASSLLSPWIGDVGRETVIVLEGRVADVEVACSGLSTLWIAIAAALVLGHLTQRARRARRARRWRFPATTQMAAVVVTVVVLVAMTTIRVAVLAAVALGPTSLNDGERQLIGSLVHVPLGLIALLVAVSAAVLVQRLAPCTTTATTTTTTTAWLTPLLSAWLMTSAVGAAVRPPVTVAVDCGDAEARAAVLAEKINDAVGGQRAPLSFVEQDLYGRHAEAAVKLRLADGGSLLAVQATRATAHHAPERCLGSAGHEIGAVFDVDDDHGAYRVLVLDGGRAVSVSFFVSDALPVGHTIAGLGERMALSWRARLRGAAPPSVTFVSTIWPRDDDRAVLDDVERGRVRDLRSVLARTLRTDLSVVEHR